MWGQQWGRWKPASWWEWSNRELGKDGRTGSRGKRPGLTLRKMSRIKFLIQPVYDVSKRIKSAHMRQSRVTSVPTVLPASKPWVHSQLLPKGTWRGTVLMEEHKLSGQGSSNSLSRPLPIGSTGLRLLAGWMQREVSPSGGWMQGILSPVFSQSLQPFECRGREERESINKATERA